MKRNKLWARLITFALVTGSSAFVSHLASNDTDTTGYSDSEPISLTELASAKMVTSADSQIQLTIPSAWQDVSDQYSVAPSSLVVESANGHVNVNITSFAKADAPQFTSDLAAQVALDIGMGPLQDATILEQDVSTTLNGYPAVMHRVEGNLLGLSMVTTAYAIETPNYYHGAIAIMPAESFELNQAEIDEVMQSFDVSETTAFEPEIN